VQTAPPPERAARTTYTFLGAESPPPPEPQNVVASASGRGLAPTRVSVAAAEMAALEAYSMLQTNIAFSRPEELVRVLVLTSALSGDGKTTTAVNLAVTLTQRGQRVLLIDADLRKGRAHAAFDAAREPGLSELLQGVKPWEQVRRTVGVGDGRTLHYVASGKPPQSPSGMLESPAFRAMLERLRADYDRIIIDAPPVTVVTDATLLSALADGVLLVARAGATDAQALEHAMEHLRQVRAPVLGVVLNDIDFSREARYDRAYRFYNSTEYLRTTGAGAA
jgi:capsular exopolysaccharide synthesis family protein